jgi:GT2 family glycosyltransferase
MSTSIVIPVYSRFDLLHQLLYDLYQHCSLIEEVIICNDKPDDQDVRNGLVWWKQTRMLPIEVIETSENLGFLRASNLGLKAAVEDNVILISTDVRVHKDIVQLVDVILRDLNGKALIGGKIYNESTGWNEFNGRIFPYVEGWILGARKQDWEELGYFDERFVPNDYEDISLSTKAISLGYSLVQFNPPDVVSHIGAQSIPYGDEREAVTKKNRKVFESIWLQH